MCEKISVMCSLVSNFVGNRKYANHYFENGKEMMCFISEQVGFEAIKEARRILY